MTTSRQKPYPPLTRAEKWFLLGLALFCLIGFFASGL